MGKKEKPTLLARLKSWATRFKDLGTGEKSPDSTLSISNKLLRILIALFAIMALVLFLLGKLSLNDLVELIHTLVE